MKNKKIILTGDRPTGKLHLGHYVGSLQNRVKMQESGEYEKIYIMIADSQALTDNAKNIEKVQASILEVLKDYLAAGMNPDKVTIFLQSQVSELCELTFYYMNLVTVSRLMRNPTIKDEIKQRGFDKSIPLGFLAYPVSQAADITAFDATEVPVGDDQAPVVEVARELVRSFNYHYGETLVEPEIVLVKDTKARRLKGLDGNAKMSKSLGNCIYLSDDAKTLKQKVMSMYTDPNHLRIEDPGSVKGNVVFEYLDVFSKPEHFKKYLPEYKGLKELKDHYQRGGLGDVKIKTFLVNILEELLKPIREKRLSFEGRDKELKQILADGSKRASAHAAKTLERVRSRLGLEFLQKQ